MADNQDAGIYNIKAVVHVTGVAADTLRRWESRYGILAPPRTIGGYRMYSQRDVDTIRWLKARVDEGLTISRACELWRTQGTLAAPAGARLPPAASAGPVGRTGGCSLPVLVALVLDHLERLEEAPALQLIGEALALYSVEQVIDRLVAPALEEAGECWARGSWTVAQEHFASGVLRGWLANLLHSSPSNAAGPLVLVACAPEELHEIGVQIVALYLRRAGYRVIYLGQNVPLESLESLVRRLRPAAIGCSAARPETAARLRPLRAMITDLHRQTGYAPILVCGGAAFNRDPHLAEQLGAAYLGPAALAAVERLRHLAR